MIRPLTAQVLVEVLPPETKTDGGLFIPDVAQKSPRGEKTKPFKALVVAIGPWRKTKQGFAVLPDFGIGHTVLCTPYAGQAVSRNIGERYQLVKSDDVLAVVETRA
jgi:chaperonin GroES